MSFKFVRYKSERFEKLQNISHPATTSYICADQQYDLCDISLCTATTKVISKPQGNCTWKRSSQAVNPIRRKQPWGGSFSSLGQTRGLNGSMMLMQVKEENSEDFTGSQFGGVTIGVGNLLYQNPQSRESCDEERDLSQSHPSSTDSYQRHGDDSVCTETSEYLIIGRSSVSCTYSTSDESSIEVSMPVHGGYGSYGSYEFDTSKDSTYGALYEKARLAEEKYMQEEAQLEDQKRLVREQLLADEVRLVEMTRETKACHLQREQLLSKLAADAQSIEDACHAEEARLSITLQNVLDKLKKKRNTFQSIRLEEEKRLLEEEKLLAEKRRKFEEEYRLEEARLAEQTRQAEVRLLEQARLAEERHQAVQKRLEEISLRVELARQNAEEARLLVNDDPRLTDSLTFDSTFSICGEKLHTLSEEQFDPCIAEIGYESLSEHHWRELNSSTFSVRGKNYFVDSKKEKSGPNLLRLMTVDLIQVKEPMMTGICCHPRGRVSTRFIPSLFTLPSQTKKYFKCFRYRKCSNWRARKIVIFQMKIRCPHSFFASIWFFLDHLIITCVCTSQWTTLTN